MDSYTEDQFLLYLDEIKQLKLECESGILSGKCKSMEDYKEMTGRIKAYSSCLQLSIEFLNKMRSS